MSDTSSNLGLPFVQAAQAQKHVTINESLLRLDALAQGAAISRTTTAQPASPVDGQAYVLPAGKTGADWGGMANNAIAYYRDGIWEQITPKEGWTLYARDEDQHVVFNGVLWAPLAVAAQSGALRNRLDNPAFAINQRGFTSVGDDAYCFDRWYVLTESGAVTIGALAHPEAGRISAIRLTQPDASPKRIGVAQIVESASIADLRSLAAAMAARVRCSAAQAIRMAILEWTGTADAVTSDVVSNWASTSFAAGGFFIAGAAVIATGAATPAANTWADLTPITGAFGASMTNAIVMIWAEAALAQNATLDIDQAQLEPGASCAPFARLDMAQETLRCQRFFEPLPGIGGAPGASAFAQRASTNVVDCFVSFKATKRIAPSLVSSGPSYVSSNPTTNNQIAFYSNETPGYATISGALTLTVEASSANAATFRATAGTSFSAAAGHFGVFYLGSAAMIGFSADL